MRYIMDYNYHILEVLQSNRSCIQVLIKITVSLSLCQHVLCMS
jgi:hypothetical protein